MKGSGKIMVETIYTYSTTDDKAIEKLVMKDTINYIHMVFNQGEGLPEHHANATLYMNVIRGTLSLQLDEQPVATYSKGTLIEIPKGTKMNVNNQEEAVLELIVVKSFS